MRQPQDDFGETLVEVLMTVAIIGIALGALIGALTVSLSSSVEHRSLANIDTVLRSYAETIKYDVQLQSSPWYVDCAGVTSSAYNGRGVTAPPGPTGWTQPYIVGIQYLNGSTASLDNPCQAGDFQLLTVGLRGPDGTLEQMTFGVRSPS